MAATKSYLVGPGQRFTYPADPVSLRIVTDAGGVSQLSDEQRAKVKFKTVSSGADCSDMSQPALRIYLERGWVLDVTKPSKEKGDGK